MDEINNTSKSNKKFRQYRAAIFVNFLSVTFGITCGWASPILPLLKHKDNPVNSVPITEEDASWIASLMCLGGLVTTPFLGSLIEKLGRKKFGYLTSVPAILPWILSIFATSYEWLFVARFLNGVAGAMSIFLVPMYVSEIASEDIRGALGTLLLLTANTGVLLAFTAGTVMSYVGFNIFSMIFILLFLATFVFLPETPVYLMRQDRYSEAVRSITYFMGDDKAAAELEISRLQSQMDVANSSPKIGLWKLFSDRATRKGLIISLGLFFGQQFSGINIMLSYGETVFKMSGSSLSPATATIIIGVIQVFGSYLSTSLIEKAGRRTLVLVSCAGMCISHCVVGAFCILQQSNYDVSSFKFAPIAALSLYMVSFCLGMGPVPYVVASEVFRSDVSSTANTICFCCLWLSGFIVLKMFGNLVELIGIGGCFLFFGACCASIFCFEYIVLPETKGRLREDIVDELAGHSRINFHNQKTYSANNKDFIISE